MNHDSPSRTITVPDGSIISIRPIAPEDRALLEVAFAELSDESRYRRFLSPMSNLSPAQLDYLIDVDHHDHEALIALDEGAESLIGVARYVRTGETVAEPAVAVADDWQRRGVGTALLDALVDRAIEAGIASFSGYVPRRQPRAAASTRGVRRRHGRELRSRVPGRSAPAEGDSRQVAYVAAYVCRQRA